MESGEWRVESGKRGMTPDFWRQPRAESSSMSHTSRGDAIMSVKEPKNQRRPSDESNERTPSILVAESSHERMTRRISAISSDRQATPSLLNTLFIIGFEVIDVEDAEFEGTDYEARGVDTTTALWDEFLDEFVLTFLQTFHAERHTSQIGDLLFGIAQGQMSQETFIILIDLIVHKRLLLHQLSTDGSLETLHNLL